MESAANNATVFLQGHMETSLNALVTETSWTPRATLNALDYLLCDIYQSLSSCFVRFGLGTTGYNFGWDLYGSAFLASEFYF